MAKVYSKAIDESIEVGRIIREVRGDAAGPTLIFIAGVHGNEPAGVFAVKEALDALRPAHLRGIVIGLAGNLPALESGQRFVTEDLNRIWTSERIDDLSNEPISPSEDASQQAELYQTILEILRRESGPYYFFDLHTTSSETVPFLTVNDNLLNRTFAKQYPLPMVLGIEEYLTGPLLSFINELGYVSFGFEAGQHDNRNSIDRHRAFISLSLAFTGGVPPGQVAFEEQFRLLAKSAGLFRGVYEIIEGHAILPGEKFFMQPGYQNFQRVRKQQTLATSNGHVIKARRSSRVLMPLYQSQGDDGFFLIRAVPNVFLRLSTVLRRSMFARHLSVLPGVRTLAGGKLVLVVNRRIARFLTKPFFHLFGYRCWLPDADHYIMTNRETNARNEEYPVETWERPNSPLKGE